jgi:nitrate/nitrite transporter NarK
MEELWVQRWKSLWFVAILAFVFAVNYTNHGPLVPTLIKELEITFAMAGFLTTAIFVSHGFFAMPGGALADKLGAKKVMSYSLGLITAGNILIGLTNSYYLILVLKFLIGFGTGTCAISGARYVQTFFAGKEIQRALGVFGGSILLGSGFVIYGIPQLLPLVGNWHYIFIITGCMAGVFFVFWLFFAPNTPLSAATSRVDWPSVVGSRNIWLLSAAQLASFGGIIVCGVWVNTLLIKGVHLDPKTAGIVGSGVLLMGIISRPLGGVILGHKIMTPRNLVAASGIGLGIGFIWIGLTTTMAVAIPAVIFTGVMAGLPYSAIFNGAKDYCPKSPGVAMGFVNTWGCVAIMAFPPIIGKLVDITGTFVSGLMLLGAVAIIAGLACLGLTQPGTIPIVQLDGLGAKR